MSARRLAGFTIIELLVSTLVLGLFMLFYLEWSGLRVAQARQVGLVAQIEHIRTAVYSYARDHRRGSVLATTLMASSSIDEVAEIDAEMFWPVDSALKALGAQHNIGLYKLLQGGYISSTLASVYPGGRWVFYAHPKPKPTTVSDKVASFSDHPWMVLRYEALERDKYRAEFEKIEKSLSYWSRALPAEPDKSVPCKSDLSELGQGGCVAIEIFLPAASSTEGLALDDVVVRHVGQEDFHQTLIGLAEDHTLKLADGNTYDVHIIDMAQSKLLNFSKIIVGAEPQFAYHDDVSSRFTGVPSDHHCVGLDYFSYIDFDLLSVAEQGGSDVCDSSSSSATGDNPMQAWHDVQNASNGKEYLAQISGLYAEELHLGHTSSEPPRGAGIWELPIGTGMTTYKAFAMGGSMANMPPNTLNDLGLSQAVGSDSSSGVPEYMNQPEFSVSSPDPDGTMSWSVTAVKRLRAFAAINVGYAGFNKAVVGMDGLYVQNLILGDQNSARNESVFAPNGARDESLSSYFSEFRLNNVTIYSGNTNDPQPVNPSPSSTVTQITVGRYDSGGISQFDDIVAPSSFSPIPPNKYGVKSGDYDSVPFTQEAPPYSTPYIDYGTKESLSASLYTPTQAIYTHTCSQVKTSGLFKVGAEWPEDDPRPQVETEFAKRQKCNVFLTKTSSEEDSLDYSKDALYGKNPLQVGDDMDRYTYRYFKSPDYENCTLAATDSGDFDEYSYRTPAVDVMGDVKDDWGHDKSYTPPSQISSIYCTSATGSSVTLQSLWGEYGKDAISMPQEGKGMARNVGLMDGMVRRSDARLKKSIRPLEMSHSALSGIRAYQYARKQSLEKQEIGFLAQEVREHYPDLVEEDDNGYLSLRYESMVPVLWGHVRQLSVSHLEQSERMEQKLQLLEAQLNVRMQGKNSEQP